MSPVLAIVPTEGLPFWTSSTNHKTVPVPPARVAVKDCGCEVVTAERCGERETVTLEVGGGVVGVDGVEGVVEEAPPPQAVSQRQRSSDGIKSLRY